MENDNIIENTEVEVEEATPIEVDTDTSTEESNPINELVSKAFAGNDYDEEEDSEDIQLDQTDAEDDNGNTSTEQSNKAKAGDQTTYEIKRQGEVKKVTLDELKSMAQQHWDYSHVRDERDNARVRANFYEKTFENVKGNFDTIWDLIDDCNAQSLVKQEAENGRTLDFDDALARVKANRESLFAPKTSTELQKEEFEGVKNADISLLKKSFPDTDFEDPKTITEDVWKTFKENGGNLTAAYMQSIILQKNAEIEKLKNEYESVEQNVRNKMRSSGSSKSSGAKESSVRDMIRDAFAESEY